MKKITLLMSALLFAAMSFAGEFITCAEAVEICKETGETSTTESYTIRGYVTQIKTAYSTQYKNISFWMADAVDGGEVLQCYRVKPVNAGEENVKVGDYVEVNGTLVNYYGNTPEVNAGGTYTILTAGEGGETPDTPVEPEEPEAKVVTVAEFIAAPEAKNVYYELTGTIGGTINTTYGNFDLTDETGIVYVYGLTKEFIAVGSTQNDQSYSSLGLKEGDKITIRGFRGSYNGKIEVMGAYFVKLVEAGETPDTPVEPEEPEEPETPAGEPLADGYAKVTNMATLADGDKVVLYCDAYAVGVTGFDGKKSATMGEAAWVEYVVETVEGGIMLKDEDQYIALTEKNSFRYNAEGSVLNVTENAMLSAYLGADGKTYFLYRNANTQYGNALCRMYVDKSGNDEFAPFYVYEVVENSEATGLENVVATDKVAKVIKNGQIYIIKGGKTYNALGAEVK